MKKILSVISITVLMFAFSASSIHAGSGNVTKTSSSGTAWVGDNSNIKATWSTGGQFFSGDWIKGTMSGYGNQKQVTAKCGSDATVSSWVGAKTLNCSTTDYGPWSGSYSVKFAWK